MLPLPSFYNRNDKSKMFYPHGAEILAEAMRVRKQFKIQPAAESPHQRTLVGVDFQNTFCSIVNGQLELLVANADDHAANTAEFIYRYADKIENIHMTVDWHSLWQIDMPGYWVYGNRNADGSPNSRAGEIVEGNVQITYDDYLKGVYDVNPQMEALNTLGLTYLQLKELTGNYLKQVKIDRNEDHAKWMGHAYEFSISSGIIPILYDALLYWQVLRGNRVQWFVKGTEDLSQRYSPIRNQVLSVNITHNGKQQPVNIGEISLEFIKQLMPDPNKNGVWKLIFVGEASSHCLKGMVEDTAFEFAKYMPAIIENMVLFADCMGPVIIPGVVDYTILEKELFNFCANNNIQVMNSTDYSVENMLKGL